MAIKKPIFLEMLQVFRHSPKMVIQTATMVIGHPQVQCLWWTQQASADALASGLMLPVLPVLPGRSCEGCTSELSKRRGMHQLQPAAARKILVETSFARCPATG